MNEACQQCKNLHKDIELTLTEGKHMYPKMAHIFDSLLRRYRWKVAIGSVTVTDERAARDSAVPIVAGDERKIS